MAQMDGMSRAQATRVKQQRRDLRAALADPAGRRVLCAVLYLCGYAERCIDVNTAGSLHRLSRRSVAVDLIDLLTEVEPRALQLLLDEAAAMRRGEVQSQVSDDNE